MDPGELKRKMRRELAALPAPSPELGAAVVARVGEWLEVRRPAVVVGFLAMESEIDMTPLVPAHPGIRFALTRTGPGISLSVHDFHGPREMHPYGFEQPATDAPVIPLEAIDVVLVPGVAFGPDGSRLGRGAGYYDRFLARLDVDTVALSTAARIRSDIPTEAHDVKVRWIATEDGVKRASD